MNKTFSPQEVLEELDLTLEATEVKPITGKEYLPEESNFVMSSGIERTPGGRLWVSWFGGGDSEEAYILLAKSDDDGKSWSDPQFIIDPENTPNGIKKRALVGNLWTDPNGKLWLFFDQALGYYDGRAGVWSTVCENPDSESPTWSTPVRIWHGAALNKPTVLSNGEWLLPISLWPRKKMWIGEDMWAEPEQFAKSSLCRELDDYRMANIFISNDQGKSWTRRGGVIAYASDFDEQAIIERKDGSLLMYLRTDYGFAQTESFDQGRSWTGPLKTELDHASSRIFVKRLQSGKVLMIKHGDLSKRPEISADESGYKRPKRSHLSAYLSNDDGKSWYSGLLLDERDDVSYPDGFQAPDGRIFIAYDRKRIDGELLMAIFTEEDIEKGEFASKGSASKMSIKKTAALL